MQITAELAQRAVPITGGWHVRVRSDGEYCIDVFKMAYNYRIVLSDTSPEPHETVSGAWCYFGHGEDSEGRPRTMQTAFIAAMTAALAWHGYGEPPGYDKRAL